MKRLCQSSSEQCFSRIIFCALCSQEGAENKAGSEAVRTIPLPEKNNNDVVTSMALIWSEWHDDLVSVSWFPLGTVWKESEVWRAHKLGI